MPNQSIPDPHFSFRGPAQKNPGNLDEMAAKWAIPGMLMEPTSTVSLYAGRLIDRETGRAYSADELLHRSVTAASLALTLEGASAAELAAVQDALTPTRILYVADLPATWHNGDKTELMGVIPLTAAQAVVGTKIRVRGEVRVRFQGSDPTFGLDEAMFLVFNVAADAANRVEGVGIVLNAGNTAVIIIDAELELKSAGTGKYKVGLGSSTPTYLASALRPSSGWVRWGEETTPTSFIIDPTTSEDVGSTAGLVVQLQQVGGTSNLSVTNFHSDLSYEFVA